MTILTITLAIWMPVLLGVAVGYLVPQMLVRRAVPESVQETPGTPAA